jgi:sacsin
MYPEGPQQLSELIQNADDAKATVVKFIISKKQHGKSSLLGQKMNEWQGGGLYCFNDATFTARDFQNLSKIGQASKLQKLVTTGRFGLGFNSVFHWTDVPSLVSGDYLVMFDPHAKFVPGATDVARGIKVRFSNSELVDQFPDQMQPYQKFGCDMKNKFNGTLFRFPFRNAITAAESEISKKQYGEESAIEELLTNFKKVISKLVLFLRHVKRVEVHLEEDNDDGPKLLYYAEVTGRKGLEAPSSSQQMQSQASGFDGFRSLAANTFGMLQQSNDWNAIANYISGSGSDSQAMSKVSGKSGSNVFLF